MFIFKLIRKFIVIILVFIFGAAAGGYIVTKVQPRSFLSIKTCTSDCLRPNELLGILGSIGIQYTPNIIPGVVMETNKTVVVKHPRPSGPIHYVVVPKKDIKNIAEVSAEDQEYVQDSVAVIGELVRKEHLDKYRVITNGPGYQSVAYLHFHLISK